MIRIEFVGAAQTVTGSKHLVHTKHATVLLDCGLFQGRRRESYDVNKNLGFRASDVDVAVLSHAHIDHSGALPMLCKSGFDGTIYATPATRDLCAVMLEDAAAIQEQDADYINRAIEKEHAQMERVEPLYEAQDVVRVLERMISVPYARTVPIADGVKITFHDAGHVLGSAITVLDIEDEGTKKRILFTGDLGRNHIPILRDPENADGVSVLVSESTYGDRLHPPLEAMDEALVDLIGRVSKRGGKIIMPSFALERAQEIVYAIKRLRVKGLIPNMPGLRRLAAHGEDHRRLQDAPRVLRRGDARAHREPRVALRVREPPLRLGARGQQGDRREPRAVHHHLGERDVRGGARRSIT